MIPLKVLQIYRLLFLVLHTTLVKSTFSYEPQNSLDRQAFIQSGKEVKYVIDGVPISDAVKINIPSHLSYSNGRVSASPVRFDPPYLDFKENPIGQPHLEQVTLLNPDAEKVVHLLSISASTPHFHCSFFHDKVVPKGGNTTFDVVFLAREVGNVENTLYIQTSRGTYKYQVFGVGLGSPYRLQSFVGAKIPLNSSFSPFINFYNPHSFAIQITEMYTSGSDLHLELPNGLVQATRKFWEVPPFETRTIMRLRLVGRREANNTAFVRIKTNLTEESSGFVIPVEVEVTSKAGIYHPSDKLNFGILRTLDNPKPLKFILINNSNKTLHITHVELEKPNDAIRIDFRPVKILPNFVKPSLVAVVTFTALKATHTRQWSGNIIARTQNDEFLIKVPYTADILHGSLEYEANITKFYSGDSNQKTVRSLQLTNKFNFTVVIYSVSLQGDALKIFNIKEFHQHSVINPMETKKIFNLEFNPKRWNTTNNESTSLPQFITQIGIFSNASLFVIPLFVYHGKLTIVPHRPEQFKGHLQFGTLGVNEVRSLNFTLRNENPVDVYIQDLSTDWEHITVELRGIERGKGTTLSSSKYLSLSPSPMNLKPYHFAMYTVTVKAPSIEMVFVSKIQIKTQYETFEIPYYLITAGGSLTVQPDPFILENSFPGKVTRGALLVKSSFQDHVELKSVSFHPNDTRFNFEASPSRQLPRLLNPKTNTEVGHLLFDPSRFCHDLYQYLKHHYTVTQTDDSPKLATPNCSTTTANTSKESCRGKLPYCYVGFDLASPLGVRWLEGTTLKRSVSDLDLQIYNSLLYHWELLQQNDNHVVNTTLLMDTNQVRGFLSKVQTSHIWPSIVSQTRVKDKSSHNSADLSTSPRYQYSDRVDFGLSQLGNSSLMHIVLNNPSDRTVVIQAVPLPLYPNPSQLLERFGLQEADFEMEKTNIFSVTEPGGNSQLESQFNIQPHNESTTVLLPPRARYSLRLSFQPISSGSVSTLLLLRNNLTGLERIQVSGRGGEGEIKFDMEMLQFELTEKHLRNCDKSAQVKGSSPSFTVRRPFVIRNSGQLAVYIQGFSFGPSDAPALTPPIFEGDSVTRSPSVPISPSVSLVSPGAVDNIGVLQAPRNQHLWCSGYGFEVPDCHGFQLAVNQSRKIEIIFTPDFSLHRVQQQLRVYTSLSKQPLNVTVLATLPQHMLYRCSQALERPDMEFFLWYILLVMVSLVALCIVGMAYCEADRIFTRHVLHRQLIMANPANQINPSKVFDLRPGSLYSKNALSSDGLGTLLGSTSSSDCVLNQNGKSNHSGAADLSDILSGELSQPMKQQQVTMLQTETRKKRRFFHDIYQWFNQRSSLKPKLEPNSAAPNGHPTLKSTNHSSSSISSTLTTNNTAANKSSTNQQTSSSAVSASTKPTKTNDATESLKKNPSGTNSNSQPSVRSRRQNANSAKHNHIKSGTNLTNNKVNSKPVIGAVTETSPDPPDFAPIPIPRHSKNSSKRGGGLTPLQASILTSANVPANKKASGKKLSFDENLILGSKHSQSAEDSISVSTDSSTEDKTATLTEQPGSTVRYRGQSDDSKLEEPSSVKSRQLNPGPDSQTSNHRSNKRPTVQEDDGNDAEDEEDDINQKPNAARPPGMTENKANQMRYFAQKRNKQNVSHKSNQHFTQDRTSNNQPNRPFNKSHKAPITSIVKPVQQQKRSPDAQLNQSHSSSESELPLWEDVPVESLKPENIDQLSTRTEQFARFSDFLAPGSDSGQFTHPPHGPSYSRGQDGNMYCDNSLNVVGAPKVLVANPDGLGWTPNHPFYIQQQQQAAARGLLHRSGENWIQPLPEHMVYMPQGAQMPPGQGRLAPVPHHYQPLPPGHPAYNGFAIRPPFMERNMEDSMAQPVPDWSAMSPAASDPLLNPLAANEQRFSLPRITQDRRQSMLEYERRCYQQQQQANLNLGGLGPLGGEQMDNLGARESPSEHTQFFTAWQVEEMKHEAFVRGCAAAKSGQIALDNLGVSGWPTNLWSANDSAPLSKGFWNDIEPGSRDDTVASHLLPPDLLNNDSSLNSSFRDSLCSSFYTGQNGVWSSTPQDLAMARANTCSPGSSALGMEDASEEAKGETQTSSSPDISSQ